MVGRFQRDYCLNPTGFTTQTSIFTQEERRMLNSLRPDILEHEPLLVVNSNNNIMHYAFSITETLFCSRTTPLFKLSLRPVLSVISASPSRVLVLRLSRTIYTPFSPSSRRMQLRTILSRNSLHSRAGERDN